MNVTEEELINEFESTDRNVYMLALLNSIHEVLPEYIDKVEKSNEMTKLYYGRMLVRHIEFVMERLRDEI